MGKQLALILSVLTNAFPLLFLWTAGDHVKFTFPMAYSTTTLTWGLLEYWDAYEKTGELENALSGIKWALDFLAKAHTAPDEFYVQIGDGGADHGYWGPPENMDMWRPSRKVDAQNPGSEPAAEAAAALAAGYLVFKDIGEFLFDFYSLWNMILPS